MTSSSTLPSRSGSNGGSDDDRVEDRTKDDASLLLGLRSPNDATSQAAFEMIMRRYSAMTRRIARRLVEGDVAADITQDIMFRMWAGRKTRTIAGPLDRYFARAAKQCALQHIRNMKTTERCLHDHTSSLPTEIQNDASRQFNIEDLRRIIRRTLPRVTPMSRDIFVMHYYGEVSHPEIAEQFGTTVRSIYRNLQRTWTAIGVTLQKKGGYGKEEIKELIASFITSEQYEGYDHD